MQQRGCYKRRRNVWPLHGAIFRIQADANSNTRYMGQGKQTHHCTPNCAERTWRNNIKLETDCPHHKFANPPYYTRYVHVRASVICYCSKCGSKYVSERTKLRSEEAAPGSMGEASHFLGDENDERNRPNDCVLYTGDLMGATECPKCKETRFDDRGKAKKEYFYFPLLETAHGLTLSEDVPQCVSDIRETAMWNEMHKEDCSPMLGKYRKLWNEVATDQSLQTISKRQIQEEVNTRWVNVKGTVDSWNSCQPRSRTHYFHEVDRLRQSIVDCVSGEHSKCSLELGCPEYPSNPDSRGPAPEIPGGGNLAPSRADRDALQAMTVSELHQPPLSLRHSPRSLGFREAGQLQE
ncbi:COP9 signalosome complex subunit 2 [Branchiostoma belcheri]|nr:COP9 signalosome complex subunit 2 [Branchiostoma belcheri]